MANTKEQQSVKDIEKIAEMMLLSITQDQNQILSIQDELEQKIKNQSEELKSKSLAINNLKKAFMLFIIRIIQHKGFLLYSIFCMNFQCQQVPDILKLYA